MPLIFGQTASGLMVPVLVGTTGIVTVSGVVTLGAELPAGTNEIGSIQARNYGWIDAAFHKDPLRFGYSGDQTEQVFVPNATAGTNVLEGSAVPAGEFWIVQVIASTNASSAHGRDQIYVRVNGQATFLLDEADKGINDWTTWTGAVVLSAGDKVGCQQTLCILNDDLYLRYHAVRVDIDQ